MGYTTDFTGSVSVDPPLNPSEIDYLTRFADSRRFTRIDGPYALHEDGFRGRRIVDYNRYSDGQPSLWCNWAPTADGTGIEWNGAEKFYDSVEWMQYLIDTFLKGGASLQAELASPVPGRVYDATFTAFTFDHTVNGTVEAQGEDPDDTWQLVVVDNEVEQVEAGEEPEPDSDDTFQVATLCGSMRFFPRMLEVAREMTAAGRIVLMPFDASLTGIANKTSIEHGAMLDSMHRAKIRLSQSVYVVNSGGYIGESTRSEIEYATGLGLPVEYDYETETPDEDR